MSKEEHSKAPGYMTFREAAIMFSLMPDEDAARAIKATVNYFLYGQVSELDGVAGSVFAIMKADIDRNDQKYADICKRNKVNIEKRWGK